MSTVRRPIARGLKEIVKNVKNIKDTLGAQKSLLSASWKVFSANLLEKKGIIFNF